MTDITLTIEAPRNDKGEVPTVDVIVPALPSPGDYIDYEPSGLSGRVKEVTFWWEENGTLHVIARIG